MVNCFFEKPRQMGRLRRGLINCARTAQSDTVHVRESSAVSGDYSRLISPRVRFRGINSARRSRNSFFSFLSLRGVAGSRTPTPCREREQQRERKRRGEGRYERVNTSEKDSPQRTPNYSPFMETLSRRPGCSTMVSENERFSSREGEEDIVDLLDRLPEARVNSW